MIQKITGVICFLVVVFLSSCKKLVEVPPSPVDLTSDNVYTTDATAISVLTGIYTNMAASSMQFGTTIDAISLVSALSADELTLAGGAANSNQTFVQFYQNRLSPGLSTSSAGSLWSDCYSNIYVVNIALERLAVSKSLTPTVQQQLMGEAKFLRAFFYFYLVNLYGDVPLITGSNYTTNAHQSRAPKAIVYRQIINDLKEAQALLSNNYVGPDATSSTVERVRPNKWTAKALLSRTYLYTQNLDSAVAISTQLINNTALYHLESLNTGFLKNSAEAVWQLQPVNAGWNTQDARVFVIPPTGPTSNSSTGYPVYLSQQLVSAFEPGDQRRLIWVDSVTVNGSTYYFPYKYKSATVNAPVTEYVMVFRLAEQYLIRAEAEAEQGNMSGALADLNTIRHRASLSDYSGATDQTSLLNAILHERQVELFTEWGHRWLDLKRAGAIDAVMTSVAPSKGTSWNPDWALYPLPLWDITQDHSLTQNPGY